MDTDITFASDIAELWLLFKKFKGKQVGFINKQVKILSIVIS